MGKTMRVARTEFANLIRTKAFLISVVLMPVFMGGAIIVQKLLENRVDVAPRRFAVVDRDGRLADALRQAAEERNRTRIYDAGKQVRPRFLPVTSSEDAETLSEQVRSGKLFAYLVIGPDALEGGAEDEVAYHSQSPTYGDLPRWIRQTIDAAIRQRAIEAADITPEQVRQLARRAKLRQYGLVTVSSSGEVEQAKQVNKFAAFGLPAAAMFLLFMLVMMAAPIQLQNILEEKMQRISEVLVSSVSAFELFLGKLIGVVFVSWTLSALYLGGLSAVAYSMGVGDSIPVSLYFWFLLFQLLALLIFGSIFSAFGAVCSELRDAQSMMMPAMLVVMIPMFVWFTVLKDPGSTFSIVMSLIPPATPFLMLLRVAVPPGPAAWELGLALVLTAGFTLACVWAAAKVFRIGILSQGQTPSYRRLMRWVFSK